MQIEPPENGARAMLEAMGEADLAVQQIATEGACAAIGFLLQHQFHPLLAAMLFQQLREQLVIAREIAQAKGFTLIEAAPAAPGSLH